MVAEVPSVLKRMAEMYPRLSQSHQQIADVILHDHDTAAFYTVSVLARAAGVSDATVTRFSRAFGFSGFPELSRQLQAIVRMRLTTREWLEKSQTMQVSKRGDEVSQSVEEDVQNLQMFLENLDVDGMDTLAEDLGKCQTIGIICARSSVSIGLFLQFYLNLLGKNTVFIDGEPRQLDLLVRLGEADVAIGIGFARFSRFTVDSLKYVSKNKVKTYAITDYTSSPLAAVAKKAFFCPTGVASYMDSLVAPLSLVQAVIRRMSSKLYPGAMDDLAKLERVWEMFDVYHSVPNS